MNRADLIDQIQKKDSFLCVGLDTDIARIPSKLLREKDPIFEFNKQIIDATHDLCVAYKPNLAFYEALGSNGMESLAKTIEYIPDSQFTIADAKRGDIGNTSKKYAEAFFETMRFDSITVAPYMGHDSLQPFYSFHDKWVIILGLTSNAGHEDFQGLRLQSGEYLYEEVLKRCAEYGNDLNTMFVIGATHPTAFRRVRKILPNHFFLVPGVGAQGGSIEEVAEYGMIEDIGLLINSSRSIIYASTEMDFAQAARSKCLEYQETMKKVLDEKPS